MDKPVKAIMSETLLKWVAGLMLSMLVAGGALYGKWIEDSIVNASREAILATQRVVESNQNLDIINAKVDIILDHDGLTYNGPPYRRLPSKPDQVQ